MINIKCLSCSSDMQIFESRMGKTKFCGVKCFNEHRDKLVESRKRNCVVCEKSFIPRKNQIANGFGKYCSVKCRTSITIKSLQTEDVRKKSYITAKKNGFIAYKKMKTHKNTVEMIRARKLPDEQRRLRVNERVRLYRQSNPDKVREWSQTRSGGMTGRLPKGYISDLKLLQKCRCAICEKKLDDSFHVDHITPIHIGGKHEKHNIQLLCGSCNVRKWAKHPIDYMQSRGFLL